MILYTDDDKKTYVCDFCHTHQDKVKQMITGGNGTAAICNYCIEQGAVILEERGLKIGTSNNRPAA